MIYAKMKATGKILASNSHCTVESMLSDITSDGTSAEDVVVEEATEDEIKTMVEAARTEVEKAQIEIKRLESTITPRRLRDALADDAGKEWVAAVEALIATERAKL